MWFVSKHTQKKRPEQGRPRFLRKGLMMRREGRTIVGQDKRVHIHTGVFLLWLLLFATLFYIAFFSMFFLVGVPQITGMSEVSEETLRGSVETELSGKYASIFSKRDFFLVQPRVLEERLLREYPLLAAVSVTRIFPDGIRIEVTERKKIILWCSGEPVQNTEEMTPADGRCFLIDEEGKAQESSRALLPENIPYVIFITDMSGKAVVSGEKVFDSSYGTFVVRVNEQFPEQLGFSLEPRYTTVSRFANELRAKTSEGWEVYVSSEVSVDSSLNALKLLFEKELPQEKRAKLAYIDLRAENRVYYAFREGAGTENPSDVSPSGVAEEKKTEIESKKKKK